MITLSYKTTALREETVQRRQLVERFKHNSTSNHKAGIFHNTKDIQRAASPFKGMLVDSGTSMIINRKDYIEFRVLYEIC